jgi:hypothetical protein
LSDYLSGVGGGFGVTWYWNRCPGACLRAPAGKIAAQCVRLIG